MTSSPLCTFLPDLQPSGWAGRVFFESAVRSDWCHDYDMDDLHEAFQADGQPYTVQVRPPAEESDDSFASSF